MARHRTHDDGVAMARLGTSEALHRYVVRRAWTAAAGLPLVMAAIAVAATAPAHGPTGMADVIVTYGGGIGALVVGMGGWGLVRSVRIRRLLRQQPWVHRRCRYRIARRGANGQPALLVLATHAEPEAVCSVSTTVFQYRQLPQGEADLLICGNPRRWAVVAPKDLRLLILVKRPVVPGWSRVLRRFADGDDSGFP